MTGFIGEYEATLDAKGRFLFRQVLKNNCRKMEQNLLLLTGVLKNA